jgi:antitoxin component of MazEF toxin-antitoxin module
MIVNSRLRKWGNSVGVVIPLEKIREARMKEGEEVVVEVRKKNVLKEVFGSLKGVKIDSQKFKDEIREEECENE